MKDYFVIYADDKDQLHAKSFGNKAVACDYAKSVASSRRPQVVESSLKDDLTAHDLKVISNEVDKLYRELLFTIDEDGMSPIAQTQLAIGLNLIHQAALTIKLADHYQMSGR